MKYKVLETNCEYMIELIDNTAYLVEDQWDDYFRYSTMYDLWVINNKNKVYIGKVKIGQYNMDEKQRRPSIPYEFYQLNEDFFSLGQGDYYYEELKKLGYNFRIDILTNLNDIAYNKKIFDKCIECNVTNVSLLRDISRKTVINQYRRIANGGARLTEYSFDYYSSINEDINIKPIELSFKVSPESKPPTNIHVLIGRNGVGKTHLIKNMIRAIVDLDEKDEYGKFIAKGKLEQEDIFSNVIFVSFSAFDSILEIEKTKIPYIRIGLQKPGDKKTLAEIFVDSLASCLTGIKRELLLKTIEILRSDPIFNESGIIELCSKSNINNVLQLESFKSECLELFKKLSSGHKIILLTLVRLLQKVEEKTLVFLDEPEGHLHPPLIASFIRALSELLIDRNGVAIIATHSPVILQEVPNSCVWKIRRNGIISIAERLQIECFGESIEALTSEIFGLEVTHSGYHNFLEKAVKKYGDYDTILHLFGNQLGIEAKSILKALISLNNDEEI